LRAICLIDLGFARSAIHQPLANDALECFFGAGCIIVSKFDAVAVTEIEFRQIAFQMGFANVMINASDATLENGKVAFNRV
jgi:hypothetical protein